MPRKRARPLVEFGDHWIANEKGSKKLYHFWTEPGTGRTCRTSLRTEDLQQAIANLVAKLREAAPKTKTSSLGLVLQAYYTNHAEHLPSAAVVRSHVAKLVAVLGKASLVETLTESKQRAFVERCLADGNKLAYAARIMTTLSAAMSHSDISDPKIVYTEADMVRRWKMHSAVKRKAYIPTDDECALLAIANMPEMLRRWLLIQVLTGGRPQTAVDLSPPSFNREAGVVDLNTPGRAQNKKFRSKVKAGRALRILLIRWEKMGLGREGRYCSYTMEGIKSAHQRLASETGIPISTYSWRQKVTTVLRRARVPEDQVSELLGHRRPNLRTTAGYGDWDPDYQREAAAALDAWFWRIRKLAKTVLLAGATNPYSQDTPKADSTGANGAG